MFRQIDDSGPPVSKAELQQLEHQLKCELPADYVLFLLRANGGSPTPDGVPVEAWTDGGPVADLRMLYHYTADPAAIYGLEWNRATYDGRLPQGLLPVGENSCGDQFCLQLTGPSRGAVVLWDHEAEHKPPTMRNVYRVAPDFAKFLELIGEYDDD